MTNFLSRIMRGVRWRSIHYYFVVRALVRSQWAQARVDCRWRTKLQQRAHHLPAPLIVSLTSYPSRFGSLSYTLRCLLQQSVRADHTILWIAHADFPLLPDSVLGLQAPGLEIRTTDDLKSYKKIMPTLEAFPDAFICTADDDLFYWPTWLEELVEGVDATNRVVTCHRAHEITYDPQGTLLPYNQWNMDIRTRGALPCLFPTCGAGALFPPGILRYAPEDTDAARSLCPDADDIWLYWIARRNGAHYKLVGRWRELLTWRGSQSQCLWHKNVLDGGNDEQIRKMIHRYGLPDSQSSIRRVSHANIRRSPFPTAQQV